MEMIVNWCRKIKNTDGKDSRKLEKNIKELDFINSIQNMLGK
jgi:hypothetical protein